VGLKVNKSKSEILVFSRN